MKEKLKPFTLRQLFEEARNIINVWDSLGQDGRNSGDFIDPDTPIKIIFESNRAIEIVITSVGGAEEHEGFEIEAISI